MILATGAIERAVPDPRLDAAGRHDGGRRADPAQVLRPGAAGPHGAGGMRAAALAARLAIPQRRRAARCRSRHARARRTAARAAACCRASLPRPISRRACALMLAVRRKVRGHPATSSALRRKAPRHKARSGSQPWRIARCGRRDSACAVDTLLLHQGVVPNVNLAMAAGIVHRWDDGQLCCVPVLDDHGATNRADGLAIAGDGAGHRGSGGGAGARSRSRQSRRSGAAARLSTRSGGNARRAARLHRYERGRAFLDRHVPAGESNSAGRAGDTIVCRCEEVTRAADHRHGRARLPWSQPDEGLPALRHGTVPGSLVRPHRDRADGAGARRARRRRSATIAFAPR